MLINIHFFRCKIFLIFVLNAILLSTEPTTVQIQESLGEAVNYYKAFPQTRKRGMICPRMIIIIFVVLVTFLI